MISSDEEVVTETGRKRNKNVKSRILKNKRKKAAEPHFRDRMEIREEAASSGAIGPTDMVSMAASALGASGVKWIDEIEAYRLKSTNLQGAVSGGIKSRLAKLKNVVLTLVGKAEEKDDPSYLRMRTFELTRQLKELQRDNAGIKKALEDSKKRIMELEN